METTFDDLVHQADQLTAEIDGDAELPRVERNLKQLFEAGQQLWSRTSSAVPRDTSDVHASVLLGSKGYDLQKVTQQLDSLSAATKVIAVESVADTDIKGFLKNERENAIMNIIEEVKKSTISAADKYYWDNLEKEWEQDKLAILNSLASPNDDDTDIDITLDETSIKMTQTATSSAQRPRLYFERNLIDTKSVTAMNTTESAFAKEVMKYVDQIVHGGVKSNLSNNFLNKVARETVGEKVITEMWEIVSIINEMPLPSRDISNYRCASSFLHALIKQARLLLEKKFVESIQGTVYGETRPLTSQSSTAMYNLVKNYLNAKSMSWVNLSLDSSFGSRMSTGEEQGTVDGHPFWCFIWHCLRAGAVDAAIEVVHKGPLSPFTNELINILREYKQSEDRRLTPKSESHIRMSYKKTVKTSKDIYKRAVYCLLGCCGTNELFGEILDKVDDYLWFKLNQIQLYANDGDIHDTSFASTTSSMNVSSLDKLTLSRLQLQISEEYGESHFDAQEKPFTYFKVLFLTGQFESAIEFLFRIDRFRSHAVHIAIALNELGLLLVPSHHVNIPLLSKQPNDPPGLKRLNFSRLISLYTRKFEASNSTESIYYYYLLRNFKSIKGDNQFTTLVSQLVRETKNYDMLLGSMCEDGYRMPGVIDKFHDDVPKIIDQVALDCENSGFLEDAIKLYDLDGKHTKVLQLITKMLSNLVPEKKSLDSKRTRLETLALKIADRYGNTPGYNISRDVLGTFYVLLDLMVFFDYYHNQQYNDALDTINKLQILPSSTNEIDAKVNAFTQFSEEIRRNIPDILLATMNILYSQFKEIKTSAPKPINKFGIVGELGNREQQCNEIRQKARALITYAGMIQYRMPGDTNARLVQLEVLMN